MPRVDATDARFVPFDHMSRQNGKFKSQDGWRFASAERNTDIPGTAKPKITQKEGTSDHMGESCPNY